MLDTMTLREAHAVAGSLGFPSKMPGTSYGISARACLTGGKLAAVPGSTCFDCYALKGNYLYPSVQKAHETRLAGISHPAWPIAMAKLILHSQETGVNRLGEPIDLGWHRWHDSGDLQSTAHLAKICVVATLTPDVKHWLPTRELAIVKAYVANGGIVPANLLIRVSATMVDGAPTRAWPHTSGVHTHEPHFAPMHDTRAYVCPAPLQEGKCGPCRACWDETIPHTTYHKH